MLRLFCVLTLREEGSKGTMFSSFSSGIPIFCPTSCKPFRNSGRCISRPSTLLPSLLLASVNKAVASICISSSIVTYNRDHYKENYCRGKRDLLWCISSSTVTYARMHWATNFSSI